MPRLRSSPTTTPDGVPLELTDPTNEVWRSPRLFDRWLESMQLTVEEFTDYGALSRFHAAAEAWGVAQSIVNAHQRPHWSRLRAMGVAYPQGRIQERLRALTDLGHTPIGA